MIFISHSSADNQIATDLYLWLLGNGWSRDQIFFDAENIAIGDRWRALLNSEARRCDAMIALITDAWLDSAECIREFTISETAGKALIPVVMKGLTKKIPRYVTDVQYLDSSKSQADRYDGLAKALLAANVDPQSFSWAHKGDPRGNPYKSFESHDVADAAVFFGREQEIARRMDELRNVNRSTGSQLIIITGPSGAGKSSFLRAGLMARMARDTNRYHVFPVLSPGSDALLENPVSIEALPELISGLLGDETPIVAIDQSEELFAGSAEVSARQQSALSRAIGIRKVIAILTIRSDAFSRLQEWAPYANYPVHIWSLPQIDEHRWPDVIRGPALVHGTKRSFSEELIDRIVADHKRHSALPILSYTLSYLYGHARDEVEIKLSDYIDAGGLNGILSKHLGGVLNEATKLARSKTSIEETIATLFFPALVGYDNDLRIPRRRQALREEFDQGDLWLLDLLVNERILTSSSDATGKALYEVSHESIFGAWPVLRNAVERTSPIMEVASALVADATDWQVKGYDTGRLVYGPEKVLELIRFFDIHGKLLGRQSQICALLLWECWRKNGSRLRRMRLILLTCWILLVYASVNLR